MSEKQNNDMLPEEIAQLLEEVEDETVNSAETEQDDDDGAVAPLPSNKAKITRKSLLIAGCSLLALILALGLVFIIFAGNKLKLIDRDSDWTKPNEDEISDYLDGEKESVPDDALVIDPDDIQWGDIPNPLEKNDGIVNILLIGIDRRPGEKYSRSDSMILCTLNKHNSTLTMTSFMRDMYVKIPGYSPNRINVAYFLGGMDLLNETIKLNFGVQVDANVEVDMEGFATCIDHMGGVDVELTQAEINEMNRRHLRENPGASAWNLKAGINSLNGKQALTHARDRYTGNGDFSRTSRQRKIMIAALEKAKTMNLTQINGLLNKFLPNLSTNMTDKEIMGYTMAVVSMFDKLEVEQLQIPANDACYGAWVDSMSVLIPDLEKNHKLLAEIMKAK